MVFAAAAMQADRLLLKQVDAGYQIAINGAVRPLVYNSGKTSLHRSVDFSDMQIVHKFTGE